jgi:hypothetical protein
MNLREIGCHEVEWIKVAHDRSSGGLLQTQQ